jgi:hypothetical protein
MRLARNRSAEQRRLVRGCPVGPCSAPVDSGQLYVYLAAVAARRNLRMPMSFCRHLHVVFAPELSVDVVPGQKPTLMDGENWFHRRSSHLAGCEGILLRSEHGRGAAESRRLWSGLGHEQMMASLGGRPDRCASTSSDRQRVCMNRGAPGEPETLQEQVEHGDAACGSVAFELMVKLGRNDFILNHFLASPQHKWRC